MKHYTVAYKEHSAGDIKQVVVLANSKEEAYEKATYELIKPIPYSTWVEAVTYQNGKYRTFNTHEGRPL